MAKRVLIVKTSSMGDILHTLPAITDAAKAIAGIRFDWVVEEGFKQIPGWHPAIDRVIPVAIRRWRKNWFGKQNRFERDQFYQRLNETDYDAIIDAQGLLKSAFLITRKAQGLRHGYDWATAREKMASWFYDVRHNIGTEQHAIERIRQLFAVSLGYACQDTGNYGIAPYFRAMKKANTKSYLVFLHATTRDNKHWPEENWRTLIQEVGQHQFLVKLPWGTAKEQCRAERLAKDLPNAEVLPRLSLQEIGHLLVKSAGVVSVDTGLSHLTAALDQKNVILYGPTDPGLIGGYGKQQFAIVAADKKMDSISPEKVISALAAQGIL